MTRRRNEQRGFRHAAWRGTSLVVADDVWLVWVQMRGLHSLGHYGQPDERESIADRERSRSKVERTIT